MMNLYHVSEEENIEVFEPRRPVREDLDQSVNLVWAVTEDRLVNFLTPRDCPRVTFFAPEGTAESYKTKYIKSGYDSVVAIEESWLERFKNTTLYIYRMNPENFYLQDEVAGYYVSEKTEVPVECLIVNKLDEELDKRKSELRILPGLWTLRDTIFESKLGWSFRKMHNAQPRSIRIGIEGNIGFRRLTEDDMKLMHMWHQNEWVTKWYSGKKLTAREIRAKYVPRINGVKPVHPYIIQYEGRDIGYIMTYRINDFPAYAKCVDVDEEAAGMDLFIGEKEFIHRGLGAVIMRRFLTDYVFPLTGAESCILGPEPSNKIAIRAYEKTGFSYLKTIECDDIGESEYLMRLIPGDILS